jgi:hypothetical protein
MASPLPLRENAGMDPVYLLTLLHLLLFCYWLGGDIGVFYSSGFVVDGGRSRQERLMAAKIMLALDLVPRICMTLMLTVGALLAVRVGFLRLGWPLLLFIALAPLWLSLVLLLHFRHGAAYAATLTAVDRALRWIVVFALLGWVLLSLQGGQLAAAPWLAAKLVGFALLVFCGLMIRRGFGGFAAGYAALLSGEPTAEQDEAMRRSLYRMRPWVLLIWVILVLEAWLGVAKPMF